MTISMSEASAAKERVKNILAGIDGVLGVGISWDEAGEPVVLVNILKDAASKVRAALSKQPLEIAVRFEELGVIRFES